MEPRKWLKREVLVSSKARGFNHIGCSSNPGLCNWSLFATLFFYDDVRAMISKIWWPQDVAKGGIL